jgi:mono/diheme cytochrome c family protein
MSGTVKWTSFVLIGALALGTLTVGAWIVLFRSPPQAADPANRSQVAYGKAVYRDQCARCHGADLEGQPNWQRRKPDGRLPAPPHNVTGHTWHHSDAQLFRLTKDGLKPPVAPKDYRSDMPAFGGILSDGDIWAVLAYIKSAWPADIRDQQAQIDAASRK